MDSKFNNSVEYDLCTDEAHDFFHRYFTLSNLIERNSYEISENLTGRSYILIIKEHNGSKVSQFICMWSSIKYYYYITDIEEH